MIGEAVRYPMEGEDALKRILIGGILVITSFLIIPAIILQGYYLRVLAAASDRDAAPPAFEEWGAMLVEGVKLIVVALVYSLVLVVATVLVAFTGEASGIAVLRAFAVLFAILLAIGLAYVLPIAMTNLARDGSIGSAFDFDRIRAVGNRSEYAVAWALAIVVGIVGGMIAGVLSLVLVGLFLYFYVQVAVYYLIGRGYADALGSEPVSEPSPDVETVA